MKHLSIEKVIGREIIDSRGNPTVEAEVYLEEELLPAEHPPVSSRLWSCVMEIKNVLEEKEYPRQ